MATDKAPPLAAGRHLDALVAVNVMGWKNVVLDAHVNYGTGRDACGDSPEGTGGFYGNGRKPVPRYSTDIAAAWMVVENLHVRGLGFVLYTTFGSAVAEVSMGGRDPFVAVECKTAPEAIAKAALSALGGRGDE